MNMEWFILGCIWGPRLDRLHCDWSALEVKEIGHIYGKTPGTWECICACTQTPNIHIESVFGGVQQIMSTMVGLGVYFDISTNKIMWVSPDHVSKLRHFTSIVDSTAKRSVTFAMLPIGKTCRCKPAGGAPLDQTGPKPHSGMSLRESICCKYLGWGKNSYCLIHAMSFTLDGGWTWQPVAYAFWRGFSVFQVESLMPGLKMHTSLSHNGSVTTKRRLEYLGGRQENLTWKSPSVSVKIKILELMILILYPQWWSSCCLVMGGFTSPPARCNPVKTIGRPRWDRATARLLTQPWCSSGWSTSWKGMLLGEVCWGGYWC